MAWITRPRLAWTPSSEKKSPVTAATLTGTSSPTRSAATLSLSAAATCASAGVPVQESTRSPDTKCRRPAHCCSRSCTRRGSEDACAPPRQPAETATHRDEAEDGRVRAGADPDGHEDGRRKPWRSHERSEGISQVAEDVRHDVISVPELCHLRRDCLGRESTPRPAGSRDWDDLATLVGRVRTSRCEARPADPSVTPDAPADSRRGSTPAAAPAGRDEHGRVAGFTSVSNACIVRVRSSAPAAPIATRARRARGRAEHEPTHRRDRRRARGGCRTHAAGGARCTPSRRRRRPPRASPRAPPKSDVSAESRRG